MPEKQDNLLFGSIAIKLGFSSLEQVNDCLRLQEDMKKLGGPPKRLGDIMIVKGYLDEKQLDDIIGFQGTRSTPIAIPGYKLMKRIGKGSMGSIYKARQISMDRVVAIKILARKYAKNDEFRERFLSEARAVAKLNHPNIIQGIDVGRVDNVHYFAMEYIDGPTVGELLRRGGALDEKRALNIVTQICRALNHAFQHGILHRDIKPDNIMLTRDGTAKLCDLGLAKIINKEEPGGTRKGTAMGTPYYISPEQARGEPLVDTRSDIYSLAATFYHMVVGQVAFHGDNAAGVIARHLTEPVTPPRERNHLISQPVDWIIVKGMQKAREDRYQMPHELLADLEATSQGGLPEGLNQGRGVKTGNHPQLRRSSRLLRGARRRFRK